VHPAPASAAALLTAANAGAREIMGDLQAPGDIMTAINRAGHAGASLQELVEAVRAPWPVVAPMLEELQGEGMVYCQQDRYFPL